LPKEPGLLLLSMAEVATSNHVTAPCTLEEAVSRLQERRGKEVSTAAPVDLLAVVVNCTSGMVLDSPVVVWLGDGSLPINAAACMEFWGSKASYVRDQKIAIGDVIRFNRVSLRPITRNEDQTEELWTLHRFRHAWDDPEAGHELYLLGHIDATGSLVMTDIHVPDSMSTERVCLHRLAAWYRRNVMSSARAISERMETPPCQYRSLDALQTSLGITSHVVASVHGLVENPPDDERRKRKRSPVRNLCYALLADAGHSIPFQIVDGRFQTVLQHAAETNQSIRLTHVKTQHASVRTVRSAITSDEVVLVATKHSTVEIVEERVLHRFPLTFPVDTAATQLSAAEHLSGTALTVEVAALIDIVIGSMSLVAHLTTDEAVRPNVLISDAMEYAVILDDNTRLLADRSIVSVLCGDQSLSDTKSWPILQFIIEERVLLRWTVSMGSRLVRVSLPTLP
jgi:hypothetical protein